MFTNPDSPKQAYPRLKGRAIEVRNLIEPMVALWEQVCPEGNELFMHIGFGLRMSATNSASEM